MAPRLQLHDVLDGDLRSTYISSRRATSRWSYPCIVYARDGSDVGPCGQRAVSTHQAVPGDGHRPESRQRTAGQRGRAASVQFRPILHGRQPQPLRLHPLLLKGTNRMTALAWDQVGERLYETGVDHGVLYIPDASGDYALRRGLERSHHRHRVAVGRGVQSAVRGQHQVPQPPVGGGVRRHHRGLHLPGRVRPVRRHARRRRRASRRSAGSAGRSVCAYRTQLGNDLEGTEHGYKLHLIYGCPGLAVREGLRHDQRLAGGHHVLVGGHHHPGAGARASSRRRIIVIDSTKVDAAALAELEAILYGDDRRRATSAHAGRGHRALRAAPSPTRRRGRRPANQPTFVRGHAVSSPCRPSPASQWKRQRRPTSGTGAQPAIAAGRPGPRSTTPRRMAGYNDQRATTTGRSAATP